MREQEFMCDMDDKISQHENLCDLFYVVYEGLYEGRNEVDEGVASAALHYVATAMQENTTDMRQLWEKRRKAQREPRDPMLYDPQIPPLADR